MKQIYLSISALLLSTFITGATDNSPLIASLGNLIYNEQSEEAFEHYKNEVHARVSDCMPFFAALDGYYKGFNLTAAILDNEKLEAQMTKLLAEKIVFHGPWSAEQLDAITKEQLTHCDDDLRVRIRNLMFHNNEKQAWERFADLKKRVDTLSLEQRQDYLDAVERRIDLFYRLFQGRAQMYAHSQYRNDLRQSSKHMAVWNDHISDDEKTESEPEVERASRLTVEAFIQEHEESLRAIKSGAPLHCVAENQME